MAVIVSEGSRINVVVPKRTYKEGALKIKAMSRTWEASMAGEIQSKLQEIATVWESQAITDYLIYAHKPKDKAAFSGYHVIPYSKNEWMYWQQLKVLWHAIFGPLNSNLENRRKIASAFLDAKVSADESLKQSALLATLCESDEESDSETESLRNKTPNSKPKYDPFCDAKQVDIQLIFSSKHMHVLASLTPLVSGKNEFHVLIIPKEHHTSWTDLPAKVFKDAEKTTYRLMQCFFDNEIFIKIKKGVIAGQTLEHCHEHFIVVSSSTSAFIGKLRIFKNIALWSSKLSQEQVNVDARRIHNMIEVAEKKVL